MQYEIKHRWTGAVLFTAELGAEYEAKSGGIKLGAAIRLAFRARADLAGANLTGANLAGAFLAGADLARADLADAYLAGAFLARANLAGANLAHAYLAGANLARANLARAYLADAKWRDGVVISQQPIQLYGLHWSVTILDAHMQIGCELHSLAEWSDFDDARIVEMDGRDALRFWREHKDALLSMARSCGRSFDPVAVGS